MPQTRDGFLDNAELHRRLELAGYPGPWDEASMVTAYNNAAPTQVPGQAPGRDYTGGGSTTGAGGSTAAPTQVPGQAPGRDYTGGGSTTGAGGSTTGAGGSTTGAGGSTTGAGGSTAAISALIDALLATNREQWEWQKEEAARQYRLAQNADERAAALLRIQQADAELRKLQFAADNLMERARLAQQGDQFERANYTNLATTLLSTAAGLTGPRDWGRFTEMVSGGRSLIDQLYGNQPRADFSGLQGTPERASVTDILERLGFTVAPPVNKRPIPAAPLADAGARVQGAVDAYTQMAKARNVPSIAWNDPELISIVASNLGVTPEQAGQWLRQNADYWKATKTAIPVDQMIANLQALYTSGSTTQMQQTQQVAPVQMGQRQITDWRSIDPVDVEPPPPIQRSIDPVDVEPPPPKFKPKKPIPLPHQIHPAVWDSFGGPGTGVYERFRGEVQDAGWDWGEFERQHYAARPKAGAGRTTQKVYRPPAGVF